jgi:PKD repeat protein
VRLRVTDDDGAQATATKVVTVAAKPANIPPVAMFTVTPGRPVAGEAATLTDQSTDGDGTIAEWSWDLNGDGVYGDATGPSVTTAFPAAGPATVGVTVTDNGGASATHTTVVDVQPAPDTGPPPAPAPATPATPATPAPSAPTTTTRPLRFRLARVTRIGRNVRVTARVSRPATVRVRVVRCIPRRGCRVVTAGRTLRNGAIVLRLPARPGTLRVVVTAAAPGERAIRRTLRVPRR